MNVYDFDKTIYDGDSTAHFYLYCLKTQPKTWKWLPYQGFWAIPFAFGILEKTAFKQKFYRFFTAIDDMDAQVENFWQKHKKNLKGWYLATKKADDVIISASPAFLLKPILDQLEVAHLIASKVDKKSGKYDGLNCYGAEKVTRFYERYPHGVIHDFYSDSLSDSPLAEISQKAFLVKGNQLSPWPLKNKINS